MYKRKRDSDDNYKSSYKRDKKYDREYSKKKINRSIIGCRSAENYEYIGQIGKGTFGTVYKAKEKNTGEIVALKRVQYNDEKDGFPLISLREIKTLITCKNENVVNLKEIVVSREKKAVFIVMEYLEHDLLSLLEKKEQTFRESEIKCLMIQLLNAVKCIHDKWIIHRDIKAANLLMNNNGILKLADFGLARETFESSEQPMTPGVVTLWYRAPEVLLGSSYYTRAIDIWSVGCIFAELLNNKPLFNGKNEIEQIDKMYRILGSPNEMIWPGYSNLPHVKKFKFSTIPNSSLRKYFPNLSENGFDLLSKFFIYDPEKRITAAEALEHPYFKELPLPKDPDMMPTWPAKESKNT